jgi:hypothetical protein
MTVTRRRRHFGPIVVCSIIEIVLELNAVAKLDRALVVWVKAHPHACLATGTPTKFRVSARTHRAAFRKEEVKILVRNGKVGVLLELLQRSETDQHFEKRK